MKMAINKVIMVLLAGFATIAIMACSKSTVTKKVINGVEYDVIKLITPSTGSVSTFKIAEWKGYFVEARIYPDYQGSLDSAKAVASVLAGKIDVGGAHVNRTIAAISNGAKVTAVVAQSETTPRYPHMTFAVLKDSPYKSAKDLVGLKYGTTAYGGCMEYTPYDQLRLNAKVPDPKNALGGIVIVPSGQEIATLRAHQADFISLSTNPDYTFSHEKDLRLFFIDFDVWGTIGGATPLYFSDEFIKNNPDTVRRFVKAIAKANNFIDDNVDEAQELTAKFYKIPKEKTTIMHYARDGIIKDDSIQIWIDTLNYYKEIKPGIVTSQIYTNAYNEFAKSKTAQK